MILRYLGEAGVNMHVRAHTRTWAHTHTHTHTLSLGGVSLDVKRDANKHPVLMSLQTEIRC